MASVVLRQITKSFGAIETIHGIDLTIEDKEFVVFVGPSGCGKSTLLRLIAGLEDITSGELTFNGMRMNEAAPAERKIAMVFQSYALYPHMTAFDNMAFGLKLAKNDPDTIKSKVLNAAKILELTPLLDRLPKQLSGGQRQRVAIGRAIVRDPQVFLFDEPLSNLDASLRVQMRIEIARLHQEMQATMVYVTHDQVEAMTLADKIVVLNDGRIEQVGSPLDLYNHPQNRFVAGFIGSPQMNFVNALVREVNDGSLMLELPGNVLQVVPLLNPRCEPGDTVSLGIRPEHLTASESVGTLPATVFVSEELGESHLLHCKLSDGSIIVIRSSGESGSQTGDSISIVMESSLCHVFDGDGKAFLRPMAE